MSDSQSPSPGEVYDAGSVARFFDAYGMREWNRLVQSPANEVSLYVHSHCLDLTR